MTLLDSMLYGLIQGLGEFLPISSSGHLAITHALMGGGENMAFDVLLHLGTLIAVFIVFFKDIIKLIKAFFTLIGKLFHKKHKMEDFNEYERFVIFVIIACVPLVIGALIDGYVETLSSYLLVVGIILIINALMLFMSSLIPEGGLKYIKNDASKVKENTLDMKISDAIIVGMSQLIAVLPGLSRSGTTITVGLSRGFSRPLAVRFSFIMSIPAILGACVLKIPDFVSTVGKEDPKQLLIYLAGMVVAAIVGILAMKLLQFIAKKNTFRPFAYYCLVVGIVAIILNFVR